MLSLYISETSDRFENLEKLDNPNKLPSGRTTVSGMCSFTMDKSVTRMHLFLFIRQETLDKVDQSSEEVDDFYLRCKGHIP